LNLRGVDLAANIGTSGRAASPPFSRRPTEGKRILSLAAYQARMSLVALRKSDDGDDGKVVRGVQCDRRDQRSSANPEPPKRNPKWKPHRKCDDGNARGIAY
jgi:hypothetical protein